MNVHSLLLPSAVLILASVFAETGIAGDWPMWRYDAGRTASAPDNLPHSLRHQWTLKLEPREAVWDDPLNHDLMPYDRVYEPIIMDGRMFVGFNDRDKVMAFDLATGQELWTFFTGAPVRLPAVGWRGRVYFCSDDGWLYCVSADAGKLLWRFQGAPSNRKAIGNRRITSAWPARGGPVVRDGQVYFAASIWPFMGTFIYGLDAETGAVTWVNDSTGSQYIRQPHSAPSFAGVAPQGALVATHEFLIVPGGRSVPAVFDRQTGKSRYFHINAGGKGTGGAFVAADDLHYYVHTREKGVRAFDLQTGVKTAILVNEPVLTGNVCFTSATAAQQRQVVRAYDKQQRLMWEVDADAQGDLIQAGDRLYAAGESTLTAIQLSDFGRQAKIAWKQSVDGSVQRLVAGNDRLVAVFLDGRIATFGTGPERTELIEPPRQRLTARPDAVRRARQLLSAGPTEGYALWFGVDDEPLLDAVVAESPFAELAIVDKDPLLVERLRRRYDAAQLDGRVTVHAGSAESFKAPQYCAHRVFASSQLSTLAAKDRSSADALYASVRPYGGVLQLILPSSTTAADAKRTSDAWRDHRLERADVELSQHSVLVRRVGQLPGAADWTHQHGNIGNTVKSNDKRVKLPLGVLWFGGNSNVDVLPRHGHGPPEQVIGGRLFIQGINQLSARDVYTGRVLWKRMFDDLGTFDVYYDATYRNTPLDPSYNQVHIPGANARGTNYVATRDRVYVLEGSLCHILDPATGEFVGEIRLPQDETGFTPHWGFIGVYEDVLIGGGGFANYRTRHGLSFQESDGKLRRSRAGFGSKSYDRAASSSLVGFDRISGKVLWKVEARHSFWHNGIVAGDGKVFCLDRNPKPIEDALRRRGRSLPDTYRIVAFDVKTGRLLWQRRGGVFGTWLGYSDEYDLLLQAGAAGSDRLTAETNRGMAVYQGADGVVRWQNDSLKYSGPCILHHDTILTNAPSRRASAGAFSLLDGSPKLTENPLTGELQPWTISRSYGCNNIIASEHMLTFRSGAAGFYDLVNNSGTGNLGGFKSGCTSNLVVADGVLNAPDYTKSCSCAYQNQTSLALIHMPENELWTVNHQLLPEQSEPAADVQRSIRSLGVNLGAPGDRRAESGVMWIEFPEVSGNATNLDIDIAGDVRFFHRHATTLSDAELPWVQASGVENAQRITLTLTPPAAGVRPAAVPYRVRLYFGDPFKTAPGDRVFDLFLQGRLVLDDFDLGAEANGAGFIQQFDEIFIRDKLEVSFSARQGESILSGIEVLAADHTVTPPTASGSR